MRDKDCLHQKRDSVVIYLVADALKLRYGLGAQNSALIQIYVSNICRIPMIIRNKLVGSTEKLMGNQRWNALIKGTVRGISALAGELEHMGVL